MLSVFARLPEKVSAIFLTSGRHFLAGLARLFYTAAASPEPYILHHVPDLNGKINSARTAPWAVDPNQACFFGTIFGLLLHLRVTKYAESANFLNI